MQGSAGSGAFIDLAKKGSQNTKRASIAERHREPLVARLSVCYLEKLRPTSYMGS